MGMATTTIRPGEMRAEQIHGAQQQSTATADAPMAPPFASTGSVAGDIGASVGREAVAQMRRGGPATALWMAIAILAAGYVHHYMDGLSYTARAKRMEDLVEWLVFCKLAEQQGQQCPQIPLGIEPR